MGLRRAALVVLVVGAVLVPVATASAGHRARLELALVPLQTAQLGPKNASLALDYGSGSTSNEGFVFVSSG